MRTFLRSLAFALLAGGLSVAFTAPSNAPVYRGTPGALPANFVYRYHSTYHGWPVRPLHAQHPVRGSFLDPRGPDDDGLTGYHFGIDVNVDDHVPELGAPPGMSHAVYAVDSGRVRLPKGVFSWPCQGQRIEVGHFAYWHVAPILKDWQRVKAGQQIGWTCAGMWHVHLSEWQRYRGKRVWVNPLHPGGKLAPYTDAAPPLVSDLRFFTPPIGQWLPGRSLAVPDTATELQAQALHGLVEVRARIGDPQSFLGFLALDPAWPTEFTPYRVAVRIARADGTPVLSRTEYQADQLLQTPYLDHYAPGTIEADNMQECVGPPPLSQCAGTYWLRPLSRLRQEFWDTRKVPNGSYAVTVTAWDVAGNANAMTTQVAVVN